MFKFRHEQKKKKNNPSYAQSIQKKSKQQARRSIQAAMLQHVDNSAKQPSLGCTSLKKLPYT
jgi:hypothetical protein